MKDWSIIWLKTSLAIYVLYIDPILISPDGDV